MELPHISLLWAYLLLCNPGKRNLRREQLAAVEVKARRAENSFLENNYYQRTVKVASFLLFIMTFSLIFSSPVSSLLYSLFSNMPSSRLKK